MSRRVIETGPAPDILIEKILGDLQVRGWESPQVSVNGDPDEMDLQQQDGNIRLSCRGDGWRQSQRTRVTRRRATAVDCSLGVSFS